MSAQLRIDRSVMVGCIDGLEDSGLVRREHHPRDRRAYAVTLTPEAEPALAEAEGGVPRLLDRAFGALTAAERRTLSRLVGQDPRRELSPVDPGGARRGSPPRRGGRQCP
ncbi:MarR family winged helix-turn-helix transcriptional regulator [Streptomyces globisporus]|nr:MarR family transcriptional regulator [Streptomyces globisporus]